ncbi:MAG: glycosyltransferase family 4 protein [Acidiferrobacteraceae bacterium]
MRVLWTLPYLPWPTTSGGKTRQYHLLKALTGRGHRITLLVQSKLPVSDEARAALGAVVERLIVLPRRPLKHPISVLWTLFGPQPLLAVVNGHAPALTRVFSNLLVEHWDVIQIEHSYSCEPYLNALRRDGKRFVLTEHNIESSLCVVTYNKLPRWLRPLAWWDTQRYRRWEQRIFDLSEQVIAVTDADARIIASVTRTPVKVVINGVDTRAFATVCPDASAKRVLFVGNYEYAPNVAAVEWTLSDIMPRVWALHPDAHFAVCGFALPERWPNQFPDPRIEWHGFVQDLTVLQSRSTAFLAPLRDGGGSKLKVLEAMAASLPVISTREGVSGLSLRNGHETLIGDDAPELAHHLINTLNDPARARRIGLSGRDYAAKHHDWSLAALALEDTYRTLGSARSEGPRR